MNQLHDNLLLQGDPHNSFPPYMSDANDKSLIDWSNVYIRQKCDSLIFHYEIAKFFRHCAS